MRRYHTNPPVPVRYPKNGEPWLFSEEKQLADAYRKYQQGKYEGLHGFIYQMAIDLGRSPKAIHNKIAHLRRIGAIEHQFPVNQQELPTERTPAGSSSLM